MTFEIRRVAIDRVELGAVTGIDRDVLSIDANELAAVLRAQDRRIASVGVQLVRPGDSARIVCTKDVIQPRHKPDGMAIGTGSTCLLENVAIVTCGPIVGFQEGIIDMSGPGAEHTPFSRFSLIVVELAVVDGTNPHEHEAILRSVGLKAAEYIGAAGEEQPAHRIDRIAWQRDETSGKLPRIGYVDMVLTQGLLHDTYVHGDYAGDVLPCQIDPSELLDGAVVSGNCVSACDKTTTYHHQNNPVLLELLAGHGKRWILAGVVLTNEPTSLAEKRRCADRAIELVAELDSDGVIITKEGFGNPDADLMMIIRGLESAGIKTVAITDEYAGPDGTSQSLADATPHADALVSVGNANERIELPAMQTVIGPLPDVARLAGGYAQSLHEDGSMVVELQAIVGSTNQLGFGRLRCRAL